MRRLIKKLLGCNGKCAGLSLIEALVATAILGVGFAGVYSIVGVSVSSMTHSVARQEMQLQANQILDLIESDITNVDSYIMDLTTCTTPDVGETQTYLLRGYEWCSRLVGEVGAATAGEERSINVTTLVDGRKVVHVVLESNNEKVQVVMKRVFDG